ncbi:MULTISPECIES: CoA-binding protein [unclassified Dehalobacter]|jgi:predicted CoA-binding protein|uniref:CoA-binding protein n=1 Tax=unclassified Dehalobacter TaxID=2635733 RepID=UPI000E6D4A36|nr:MULTISPECIES: CoA-binding protein [unclassified Dehalobacter]RJE48413.1 CoA-binding protein [Dehalobacter sp. MCB1]TCX50482.1 CoA-binding protein [Dehalobacter sp. 14DCB1]TCX52278.1 CoA-binding protein [Dehalobacter sp. 12DCB1]
MKEAKKIYEFSGSLNTSMRYAVYADSHRFLKHKHAWKAAHCLKSFGCRVYLVAPDLKTKTFEGSRVYPDLNALKGKVDVVVPCLRAELIQNIVVEAAECEAKAIWFQEQNWTPEFDAACRENGIEVVRGCVLKHKIYPRPFAYLNPCYWHGRKVNKVPGKYQRI